ncbi:MAG: DNRLRE domain-containing protein [Planctomycetes bacterium]|nr:DNRLRE domain-containing protein [Planctomycetota bacterium]
MQITPSRIALILVSLALAVSPGAAQPVKELGLFDFSKAEALKPWSNLELATTKEPPVKLDIDQGRLKLTFADGNWPTVTTTQIPGDWMPFHTFHATVTVSRACVVGFAAFQEKSQRGGGWDNTVSRWVKTAFVQPGKNEMSAPLHPNDYSAIHPKLGKVIRFEIFMYNPLPNEVIHVENIRLSAEKLPTPKTTTQFRVLGTDYSVSGVMELGKKLKDQWKPPIAKTVDEIELEFRASFGEIKKKHPRAMLAVFRDGEKGDDPQRPDRVYTGWKDAYWSSHGPDGMTVERATNFGKAATQEIFMRHRSPLMRVDVSSIPAGATIHAARLILVRANDTYDKERDPRKMPNMWVAEACNRPWEEYEVNAYEYAKNKFWRNYGGTFWDGDDPDFLPIYLAHGPGGGAVTSWDFAEAVRFWTSGKHPNHGFMMHSDARDWLSRAHYRESSEARKRPALLVIYEAK